MKYRVFAKQRVWIWNVEKSFVICLAVQRSLGFFVLCQVKSPRFWPMEKDVNQHRCYWWHGSLYRQVIISHVVDLQASVPTRDHDHKTQTLDRKRAQIMWLRDCLTYTENRWWHDDNFVVGRHNRRHVVPHETTKLTSWWISVCGTIEYVSSI